jgi:hypothetical protein
MRKLLIVGCTLGVLSLLVGCGGSTVVKAPPPSSFQLIVATSGTGTVTSSPAGIDCGST